MNFAEAYKLPIGEHVEKKGKFSYLSWCYAVRFLRENFPDSTWTIHENRDGLPIITIGNSHMVKITVHHEGKDFTQFHPILDNNNKPISEPTSFHINTSIHRGLTKAIGIATGIGLGLYAGEDLPKDEDGKGNEEEIRQAVESLINWVDGYSAEGATDKKGNPVTAETIKIGWERSPDVLAWKKKLDAENLKQAELYFKQILSTVFSERKAA